MEQTCITSGKYTDSSIKKKQPNQKTGRIPMKAFLQRRYPDGQRAHENMLNAANYWRNANHKYNEFSPHTGQKDQHQNVYKQ